MTEKKPYPNKYYAPFILYPTTMWNNAIGNEFAEKYLGLDESAGDYVLYISIPFCRVKCKSCPYFIEILPKHDPKNKENPYVEALIKDIQRWASYPRWRDGKLRAIYIGGGTGSILTTTNLKKIIDAIFKVFPVADDYSLTLEGNADDFTPDKIKYVAHSPINRISLGVQSFDQDILNIVGSPHIAQSSEQVIKALQSEGFDHIQLDLMYNMPGHTMTVWKNDLEKLKQLGIKHFTTYLYRFHDGSLQQKYLEEGTVPPVWDNESPVVKNMYKNATKVAEDMGFNMYMFDHYAVPGYESPYQYWTFKEGVDALGIGAGAYSFINSYRSGTKKDVNEYIKAVNSDEHLITSVSEKMSLRVRKERYVIFAFQYSYIYFEEYKKHFSSDFMVDFGEIVEKLTQKGLVEVFDNRIEMTALGQEWHMNIFLEFFSPEFWEDAEALKQPNWAMNIPMVMLSSSKREYWLGSN